MRKKIPNKPFHSSLTYQPNQETAVAEILFLIIGESGGAAAFVGTVTPNGESAAAVRRPRPGMSRPRRAGGRWAPANPDRCLAGPYHRRAPGPRPGVPVWDAGSPGRVPRTDPVRSRGRRSLGTDLGEEPSTGPEGGPTKRVPGCPCPPATVGG